jgi:hypothetical protein
MNKVVYVAGYSRSGSTLLDIALGSHPQIVGVGEVTFLLEDWAHPRRQCTCGSGYAECPFWRGLFPAGGPPGDLARTCRAVERRSALAHLLTGRIRPACLADYARFQGRLFDYVRQQSQKPVVLDSSKSARASAGRFHALRHVARQDVFVVHLVRSALATMRSYQVHGDNWALEGFRPPHRFPVQRAALGWTLSNALASTIGARLGRSRYLRLRYEDLVERPLEAVSTLGHFLEMDLTPVRDRIADARAFVPGHNVGGNRVRLTGEIMLRAAGGQVPGHRAPIHHHLWLLLTGGAVLQHRYGYTRP